MSKGNIYDAALRHLANRSRSVKEMETHLKARDYPDEEIQALIDEYKACGYLDDGKYAAEYCRYAAGKGKGKNRIFAELWEKGIPKDVAEVAYEEFAYEEDFSEEANARAVAEKILRQAGIGEGDPVPEKVRARIGRNLSSKGYSMDIIYRIINR